ncbi:MAG: MOSC domain-containing protein [Clostridiaceae bacterium]|jgi:MOSC domain-containing protein YiiM|nr:MOSC domain-containing protein [Bacillota bacterium]NLN51369.1 MOSC domain-containing protein [Clostridiaceae bacterium]
MAKIVSINRSDKKGIIKTPQQKGLFIENFGLQDDAHGGNWHRQVSLLGIESIEKMKKTIPSLSDGDFAENLTTEGLVLYELPIGTKLQIGETIQEVTQIGKSCHTGCAIKQQVGNCIMPTEGIFTIVIKGGWVHIGDEIKILEEE